MVASVLSMYLRHSTRKKDGKDHRYYSVVESVRSSASRHPFQRTLLYLGEINCEQEAAWIKAIQVFDQEEGEQRYLTLFPSDKAPPPTLPAPAVQVRVDQYQLTRARQYGACWLACELWDSLKLDDFWSAKLGSSREGTNWAALLKISVAYRLIAPGSEWQLNRQWYDQSAMGDLLEGTFHWGGRTSFTRFWTNSWNIERRSSPISRNVGRTSSEPDTKCCSTI